MTHEPFPRIMELCVDLERARPEVAGPRRPSRTKASMGPRCSSRLLASEWAKRAFHSTAPLQSSLAP